MLLRLPWRAQLPKRAKYAIGPQSRQVSDYRPFAASDLVFLRPKSNDRTTPPLLKGPLIPGRKIETHRGIILHEAIIGKRVRDVVSTLPTKSGRRGAQFRLEEVKLEEYVRLSRRIVTPIYPADANLIVSLLDLHPEVYDLEVEEEQAPKLEILEAGTGHGALTLYLSRAIHGANPPKPKTPITSVGNAGVAEAGVSDTEAADETSQEEAYSNALSAWKKRRRAIIHTIEISARHSSHAEKIVSAFRHGLYAPNIDFHVGDVSDWLTKKQGEGEVSPVPFLSHAFLDLPNADSHLGTVARALRTDGTLIVFNPSITQINECALRVKREGWALELDRVVELGVNGGSGGREWDVRPVRIRKSDKAGIDEQEKGAESEGLAEEEEDSGVEVEKRQKEEPSRDGEQGSGSSEVQTGETQDNEAQVDGSQWAMICRPKVGERIVGGGFLAVFKKQRM